MPQFLLASIDDFSLGASWLTTHEACDVWSGGAVLFPIEQEQMLGAIGWHEALNYSLHDGSQLLGIGQFIQKMNRRFHLARIMVNPAYRGHGYGRMLIENMLTAGLSRNPECFSLNVHRQNETAISLYTSLGFVPVLNELESRHGLFVYMERNGTRNEQIGDLE